MTDWTETWESVPAVLRHHYPFTEGSGTTVADIVNSNDAVLRANSSTEELPSWGEGRDGGYAIYFDGNTAADPPASPVIAQQQVRTPSPVSFCTATERHVLSGWIKLNSLDHPGAIFGLTADTYYDSGVPDEYLFNDQLVQGFYISEDGRLILGVRGAYNDTFRIWHWEYEDAAEDLLDGNWHLLTHVLEANYYGLGDPENETQVDNPAKPSWRHSVYVDGAPKLLHSEPEFINPLYPAPGEPIGGYGYLVGGYCKIVIGSTSNYYYYQEFSAQRPGTIDGAVTDVRYYCGDMSPTDVLEELYYRRMAAEVGAYTVTGQAVKVHLGMAAQTAAYVVDGQPARLIADVVTPPEVEPNPIWFSCNT